MRLALSRPRRSSAVAAPAAPAGHPPELIARRDRLREQFALMQSELGGLFYEMAVRDHLKLDVLVARAAALQQVDGELAAVEHELRAV